MARMRVIKPGFFVNETLGELDPLARLLFIGLWCIADREGRLEDRPKRIKAEVLPYDEADADALLQVLHEAGFILRYPCDEHRYIQVLTFKRHQSPHIKEAPSTIPAPYLHGASTVLDTGTSDTSTVKDRLVTVTRTDTDHDLRTAHIDPDPFAAASDDARRTAGGGGGNASAVIDISLVAPANAATPGKTRRTKTARETRAADETAAAPPAPLHPKPPRVNPLWDALVDEFGYEPGTAKERSKWGEVVKNLKAVKAAPEDIHARCAHHRAGVAAGVLHWTLTPNALVSHWGELGKPPAPAPVPISNGRARAAPPRERPLMRASDVALYPDPDPPKDAS